MMSCLILDRNCRLIVSDDIQALIHHLAHVLLVCMLAYCRFVSRDVFAFDLELRLLR
jgi:hypothetical protein